MTVKKALPEELLSQIRDVVKRATDSAQAIIQEGIELFFRFYGMDPYDITCQLLEERGEPMSPDEIAVEAIKGGIANHKSEARGGAAADVKRSISYWVGRHDSKIERLPDGKIGLKK